MQMRFFSKPRSTIRDWSRGFNISFSSRVVLISREVFCRASSPLRRLSSSSWALFNSRSVRMISLACSSRSLKVLVMPCRSAWSRRFCPFLLINKKVSTPRRKMAAMRNNVGMSIFLTDCQYLDAFVLQVRLFEPLRRLHGGNFPVGVHAEDGVPGAENFLDLDDLLERHPA